jgi:hypothetical protein
MCVALRIWVIKKPRCLGMRQSYAPKLSFYIYIYIYIFFKVFPSFFIKKVTDNMLFAGLHN